MKKRLWIGALAALLVAGLLMAQVPGKYLGFTADRFWSNAGIFRTDAAIESVGASNTLRLKYSDGVYATISQASTGATTIAFTGGTAPGLNGTATITTAALGTVRNGYFKVISGVGGSATSGNLVGVRGEVSIPSGDTIGGGIYLYGSQGKLTFAGVMDHADSRLCASLAQLDISAGTYTTGQLSALWVDAGATASASAISTKGGGQFNLLRITNTTAALSNALIYGYADADYLFDLGGPGGNADWFSESGTCTTPGQAHGWLKIYLNGTAKYIPLSAAVS